MNLGYGELLAALSRLANRIGDPSALPYVELFGDGSGRVMVYRIEWDEFDGLQDAILKIDSLANAKLSGGGPLSNETTEAESRRPLE